MHYNREILSSVLRDMEREHTARTELFAQRREEVYARLPRVREIDRELSGTAAAVLHAALAAGDDPADAIEQLKIRNLALQAERRALLEQNGFGANYLDETPLCETCGDSGYVGTEPCDCLKKRYAARLTEELSTILPITDQNFERFRLDYYSDVPDGRLGMSARENMEYNLSICRAYADKFSVHSPNLLLYGSTGLGKTFLSSCIAKVVSEHGFSVAYDTSIRIFSSYESVKFGAADASEAARRVRKYEQCDLLIIDDLGTEMATAFTVSALYGLLADRLMRRRPMIVNTNLLPAEFEKRYSPAIASRLTGEFEQLRFFGDDIRAKKRRGTL